MPYLLNFIYVVLLAALSPYLLWSAIRKGKYRAGYAEKLFGRVPLREGDRPCIWLHAVSAGEVNLLAPLIKQLRIDQPDHELVISTTTNTGHEIACKKYPDLTVFYCPLDFSWAVRNALSRVRPTMLVLAELELWPNLIGEANARGVRVAVVNGRLSEHSARGYGRLRHFVGSLLQRVDLIGVQTTAYADRFIALGAKPESVRVTGSMKFDGAQTDRSNARTKELAELWKIDASDVVFLAGSTQEPEEEFALDAYLQLKDDFPELRLIIVPRHPERFDEVAQMLDRSGVAWDRRSQYECCTAEHARVLLVDAMGELSAWWGVAQLGYVGGSMGKRGGQSMIEPAAYGVAVSFGPNTHNFRDVVRLMLQRDAAIVVDDRRELTKFVRSCLQKRDRVDRLGSRASELVAEQLGATEATVRLLAELLPASEASNNRAA